LSPIFTNVLLVDELNRTHPKTMSAFLETFEERQTTIGGISMKLPAPFTAFATQNPLKIEGTEPLPKVLSDRFIMKIDVDYPSMEEEQHMLRLKEGEEKVEVNKIIDTQAIIDMQAQVKDVELPDDIGPANLDQRPDDAAPKGRDAGEPSGSRALEDPHQHLLQ